METHLYDPRLFDPELWDRAGWRGLGYLFDRAGEEPPRAGPIFHDAAVGRQIFEAWRQRLGPEDRHEAIRFVLVSGVLRGRQDGCAVLLSTRPEGVAGLAEAEEGVHVGFVVTRTRVCHLPGPLSPLLKTLQAHVEAGKPYLLTPFTGSDARPPEAMIDLGILKYRLEVRRAEDIAADEPDAVVFQED